MPKTGNAAVCEWGSLCVSPCLLIDLFCPFSACIVQMRLAVNCSGRCSAHNSDWLTTAIPTEDCSVIPISLEEPYPSTRLPDCDAATLLTGRNAPAVLLQQHGLLRISFCRCCLPANETTVMGCALANSSAVYRREPFRYNDFVPRGHLAVDRTAWTCHELFFFVPRMCSLAALMCSNSSVSSLDCTVMVNATFPHSLPLHVNVISNALLQRLSGNPVAVIQVIDSPLPRTLNEEVSLASAW